MTGIPSAAEPSTLASQVDGKCRYIRFFPGPERIQVPNIPSTPSHSASDNRQTAGMYPISDSDSFG